jgi:hypothetical protein
VQPDQSTLSKNSHNVEESDIRVPLFYVLGREATEETLCMAHAVFITTPCFTGVVGRHKDKDLIQALVVEVLHAPDEAACRKLTALVAHASGLPVLTVDVGNVLTAVYPDGEEEEICLSKLTGTS